MFFERFTERRRVPVPEQDVQVQLGMRFDFGGPAPLKPGASFQLPAVAFTASTGDLDDIANQLHRYQRRYVMPKTPGKEPTGRIRFNDKSNSSSRATPRAA